MAWSIYDFRCQDCRHTFVKDGSDLDMIFTCCPQCGSSNVKQTGRR